MIVEEKKKAVEEFLKKQENNTNEVGTPTNNQIGGNTEVIRLLNRIVENQDRDRKEYERNNPLITDNPVYDWAELITPAGYLATFTLIIPEGFSFMFDYFNITYADDTVYNITVDGVAEPTTTDTVMDWGDHYLIFRPPRLCYRSVVITALNDGAITQTYDCFIRGFLRQSIKLDKEYLGSR